MFGRNRRAPGPPVLVEKALDPLAEARAAGFRGYAGFGTIYGELTRFKPASPVLQGREDVRIRSREMVALYGCTTQPPCVSNPVVVEPGP